MAYAWAEKLGVEATREAIAAVPVDCVLAAQAELKEDLLAHPDPERWGGEVVATMMPWQPVVDGDAIPACPFDRIVAGADASINVMVGTNIDEHRLFLVSTGAIEHITDEALASALYPKEYATPVFRTDVAVAGIVASHSLIPDALFHALSRFGVLMSPELPRTRRQHEMMTTMVSVSNRCSY